MARFTLDVDNGNNASESMRIMNKIMSLLEAKYCASITCINHRNDSQFHESPTKNKITLCEYEYFVLNTPFYKLTKKVNSGHLKRINKMTTNLKNQDRLENSKEADTIFLYSDKTDLVICEACFTEYVSIENINNYEAVNLKELETVPTCELCQGVL